MADHPHGTVDALLSTTQAVVDALSDEEANHGGLLSRETLIKAGALRLELSYWHGKSKSPKRAPDLGVADG